MTEAATHPPYDAVLVLSFGGPEGQDDVIPFLENVTRGRGIPPERLEEVAGHYRHLGGKSPLNDLNREIIAHVAEVLRGQGLNLPIYFGNRNWHPLLEDTARAMVAAGVSRALVFPTSAWAGYSGSLQYTEDVARAVAAVDGKLELDRLRQFHDHPLLIAANSRALRASLETVPAGASHRVIFTAHSIPLAADRAAGAQYGGSLYSRQIAEHAALVAAAAGVSDYDIVWQSQSGPPQVPWLEPDIVEHVTQLHQSAASSSRSLDAVVVAPIGFLSDHVEVIWDLDTELAQACQELGITLLRAPTPGPSPEFAALVAELISERIAADPQAELQAPRRLGKEPQYAGSAAGRPIAEEI